MKALWWTSSSRLDASSAAHHSVKWIELVPSPPSSLTEQYANFFGIWKMKTDPSVSQFNWPLVSIDCEPANISVAKKKNTFDTSHHRHHRDHCHNFVWDNATMDGYMLHGLRLRRQIVHQIILVDRLFYKCFFTFLLSQFRFSSLDSIS